MLRMKPVHLRSSYLCLLMMLFSCCAMVKEKEAVKPDLQETKRFEGFSIDEIWKTILQSLAEMEFTVRKEMKDRGFIFAQADTSTDTQYLPPQLNIYIRQEENRYFVTCHAVVPGQNANYEASARYVRHFFKILTEHLRPRTIQDW